MKMRKCLMMGVLLLLATACGNEDPMPTPGGDQSTAGFEITVHADRLSPWSVTFDIRPEEENKTYYYDVISKAGWERTDLAALQAEIDESIRSLAGMTDTPYEEALAGMLQQGELLNVYSGAGYRPETEFYIFAYYWDANGPSNQVTLCSFTTPAVQPSAESVEVAFAEVESHSMKVLCDPSLGVVDYYLYFDETSKVEAMLNQLGDPNAWLSYQAMNLGQHQTGPCEVTKQALKPDVEYTVLLMVIDEQGNRFSVQESQKTAAQQRVERVESPLFDRLPGRWEGRQTTYNLFSQVSTEQLFSVEIVQQVEDYDHDYRAKNQLVALVNGWYNLKYYSVSDLEAEYATVETDKVPEECFGPKWLINIAEGDQMSLDGQVKESVFGWYFSGDSFMMSVELGSDKMTPIFHTNQDLTVTLSEDGNTLTISSPQQKANPSLSYYFMDQWMLLTDTLGASDIVLTRTEN